MVVITGGSGFIGSYLRKQLPDAINLDIKEGKDILTCDLPRADMIIHLAAQPGVIASFEEPYKTFETNVMGSLRLIEHYKNSKFIFASTGGAIQNGEAKSPYGLSKLTAEKMIEMLHSDYVILRFANIYGKGSRSVVDKFLNGDIAIYGDGSATRTYCYIDDLIRGIIQSINWPKGVYSFGSDQTYSVKELAEATGKPIKYEDWRRGEFRSSSLSNFTPNWSPTKDVIDYIREEVCCP